MRTTDKLLLVVLLTTIIVLSGCISDDDSSPAPGSELYGTWSLIELNINGVIFRESYIPYWNMTFDDDGTGTADVDDSTVPYPLSGPFIWSVENNKLTISDEDNENITMDYSVKDNICIITMIFDYDSNGTEDNIILTFEKQ